MTKTKEYFSAEAHRDTGRSVQYIKKNGMHT
jgi:hypothetical protein